MDKLKLEPEKMELVGVTHVVDAISFWAMNVSDDQAMERIRNILSENCPAAPRLLGNPSPQKLYGGLFWEDGCWYRCKVQQHGDDEFQVSYIDYGNMDVVCRSALVELPCGLQTDGLAKKYKFWGFHPPSDQDPQHGLQGKLFLHNLIYGKKLRVQIKSVAVDGAILVHAFQGNLDIGEEVIKMKFAKVGLPGKRDGTHPSWLLDPSSLWTHGTMEVGCLGDAEKNVSPGCMPKLRPAFPNQMPQTLKEKSTTTALQPANLLKKNLDKELVEENERLKAELSAQRRATLLLEKELTETRSELQKVKEGVLKEAREWEVEKVALLQDVGLCQVKLGEARLELQTTKQQFEEKLEVAEMRADAAVGDRFVRLAEKVESLRGVREGDLSSTIGDSLLEAITVVTADRMSTPVSMEKLETAWKEYSLRQDLVKSCRVKEELGELTERRNDARRMLAVAVDDYIQEVDGMQICNRMDTLQELDASLTAAFGSFSMEDVGAQAFDQFSRWQSRKRQETHSIRTATDAALGSLSSWFRDMEKFFSMLGKTSVPLSDIAVGLVGLLESVEKSLCEELEVSLTEQNSQDVKIVSSAFNKAMQQIQKEQNLICGIREKYLLNSQFKEDVLRWEGSTPRADELFSIKKGIKKLKSQLCWRMVEKGSLEEAEELDLTKIMKKKEEIAETRNALFQEIGREREEYRKLSVLAKGCFPELPLLYPEADLPSFMSSDGLLVKSLDRHLFDGDPLRELSGRRPLVCTEFQSQRVVLKGYSVDEETAARMLEQATLYHQASKFGQQQTGLLPLLALFFGKSDPLAYVMVPYFTSGSLRVVQKSSPLTSTEIVSVMRGVALGLQALHGFGITHGSLHPNNVFVLNREQGLVADFDFTKTPEQRAADAGMVAGSLSLVVPEALQGQTHSPSWDVFSFGCLLLWLHCPDCHCLFKSERWTPDMSDLKLDPKLHALLSKLLVCSGRLTASEVLSDDYFLAVWSEPVSLGPEENFD